MGSFSGGTFTTSGAFQALEDLEGGDEEGGVGGGVGGGLLSPGAVAAAVPLVPVLEELGELEPDEEEEKGEGVVVGGWVGGGDVDRVRVIAAHSRCRVCL